MKTAKFVNHVFNKDKTVVALKFDSPNFSPEDSGPIAEKLLGFNREDKGRGGNHGFYIGASGLIQARVGSVDPSIVAASFKEFGPAVSRPLARKLIA